VSDLEAVTDKLELRKFSLIASRGPTYPLAFEYARRHPDRLYKLVAVIGGPTQEFVSGLIEMPGMDWEFMVETAIRRVNGWNDEAGSAEMAAHMLASNDLAGFRRFIRWTARPEEPGSLETLTTPTLFIVWSRPDSRSRDEARRLASRMPNASVQIMPDAPMAERVIHYNAAIAAFLAPGTRPPASPTGAAPAETGTAVILFTDIVDSTALTERLGDARFREASRALDERLRAAIRDGGGTPVEGKVLGDGVMASFTSAREAIAVALRCVEVSADSELALHIGLHAGDVIHEPGNVYGGTVNIASRICGLCAPGEVLVSDVVRGMARSSAGATFIDRGEHEMKGVGDPVRVFAVVANG
jgi:class 3 adenylate cyclase